MCKKDYDDDRAKQYGPLDRWYHVDCFAGARDDMVFFCSADKLSGYNTLSKDDQVRWEVLVFFMESLSILL